MFCCVRKYNLKNAWSLTIPRAKTCDTSSLRYVASLEAYKEKASVYIHWPYCLQKCIYCNFNKYVQKSKDPVEEEMVQALCTELETLLTKSTVSKVTSVFFGGGTPSLLSSKSVATVVGCLKKLRVLEPEAEISLEFNPSSSNVDNFQNFQDLKEAGITRISIGLQALDDDSLRILGRDHDTKQGLDTIRAARDVFDHSVSIDMLFRRPRQTLRSWKSDLVRLAQETEINQVSLYQLTPERGTPLFNKLVDKKMVLPDENETADMYDAAVDMLESVGVLRYEVSNFAKSGLECHHNINYWQGGQYIGIGPGAHGRFFLRDGESRHARIQTLEPRGWLEEIRRFGHATRKSTKQNSQDILSELLASGLRTRMGISEQRWSTFAVSSLRDIFVGNPEFESLVDHELMEYSSATLRATLKGLALVDSIVPVLLSVLYSKSEASSSVFQELSDAR